MAKKFLEDCGGIKPHKILSEKAMRERQRKQQKANSKENTKTKSKKTS